MGQMRVRRTGPWVKISCPFSWVQFSQGVGQAVDPHFDPHHFQRFCNKKAPKTEVFGAFWSCWADSNCRPHPYQKVRIRFILCPLVPLHTVNSLYHEDFCFIFSLPVLPCFRPFVGRFVGNPFSHHSPEPHPIRRSIAIPSNTSSNRTYFC